MTTARTFTDFLGLGVSRIATLCLLSALSLTALADATKDSLFKPAESAIANAKAQNAHLLSPSSYEKGQKLVDRAEDRYSKGKGIEGIKKDLSASLPFFDEAIKNSSVALVTFENVLKVRADALKADAAQQAQSLWLAAESQFDSAARALEAGKLKRAQSQVSDIVAAYKSAELTAIKASYLSDTRKLISSAEKQKVDRYAPLTLAKAKSLLQQAEKELTENRYDTDYPKSLAKQAKYEAKHAIFIAQQVIQLQEGDTSAEQFILDAEKPLAELASTVDIAAEFDQGFAAATKETKAKILKLLQDSYDLGERLTDISYLEKEIALLEKKLGVQSQRLQVQEAQRKRLSDVTDLFGREEAIVQTQGQNTVIRLIGLTFDPGSATIATRNFNLLNRVQQALKLYSDHHISIEGHTDSFGGDAANLKLSMDRAEAVREYILSNLSGVGSDDLSAIGYGETRPIANNETKEGRSKNRRIDIVLTPKF